MVANRHSVADETSVKVRLADGGSLDGSVVPSAFLGDLVLIRAELPEGPALEPGGKASGDLFVVGYDLQSRRIRVFPKGKVLSDVAPDKASARLHHTAHTQPGASGGALVNAEGAFLAVATSGGRGRFEAIPASRIAELKAASGDDKAARSGEIGTAYKECTLDVEQARRSRDTLPDDIARRMVEACRATGNRQMFDMAGQALVMGGKLEEGLDFFERSVESDPNSVNARLGLVVALMRARRTGAALDHVRWLLDAIPEDVQVQRFAIHVGRDTKDQALIDKGVALIEKHNPAEAEAVKRFLEGRLGGPRRPPR